MTNSQYADIVKQTLTHLPQDKAADSLLASREIFNNCGVAFPAGSLTDVLPVLKSEDYMGWRSCTFEEAQQYANEGAAAIGLNASRMVVILPEGDTADSDVALQVNDIPLSDRLDMRFFAYAAASTTTVKPHKLTVTDAMYWIKDQAEKRIVPWDIIPGNGGTQCVDLAAAYIVDFFKLPRKSMGNGKDVYWMVPQNYPNNFRKIEGGPNFIPQTGDIISLRGDSSYGHVALVGFAASHRISIIEQWAGAERIEKADFLPTSDPNNKRYIYGAARPIF